jgi:hypothetical protein
MRVPENIDPDAISHDVDMVDAVIFVLIDVEKLEYR